MRTMDLTAQYPKRNLSLANQAHKVYPYLLRDLVTDHPNQFWVTDITYIPMARALCTGSRSWTGTRARCSPGACPTRSMPVSASMRWRRRSRPLAARRFSIPTMAVNLPARISPTSSSATAFASAWTARAGGSIMSSSSACGAA